jgi:PKD repeat protein
MKPLTSPRLLGRCLSAGLLACLLLIGTGTATASADSYGELGRFGKEGTGHIQFKLANGLAVHAFGVDPTDNSVYVGDEPKVGEYRIQKITPASNGKGGIEGQFVASASIPFTKATKTIGIQGIALDPALKRLYVLTAYERREATEKEEEKGEEPVDPALETAGTLYAFSTVPTGEKLVPASVANAEGVLASKAALLAQSEVRGQALLQPAGIAVDPTTHEVIILGQSDLGTENEEEEGWHTALQRVGTTAANEVNPVTGRYVDAGNCLTAREPAGSCPPSNEEEPSSPIVSEGGNVYVGETEQIWEIPTAGGKFVSGDPKLFDQFTNELVTFPIPPEPHGLGLSFVGEGGGKGRIYVEAGIHQEGSLYRGVLAFNFAETGGVASVTEKGWTGGQSQAQCSIGVRGNSSVAGGAAGSVFVLDPHQPIDEFSESPDPHVVQFGPGGSGCPHASASEPSASVLGKEVTSSSPGAEVVLSSKIVQANALTVKWRFENATTKEAAVEESSTGEAQTTKIGHKFSTAGSYEITETIETDNLATPSLTVSRKLTIAAALPTARFFTPASATAGEEAKFNASSSEANGSQISKYIWNFGDGTAETTGTSPGQGHVFAAAGSYSVSLKVVNGIGTSAAANHTLVVASPGGAPPPPPPPPPPGGGSTTSNTPTTTTTPGAPPPGGAGGVASYKVSVASSAPSVSPAGAVALKLNCSGSSSCKGTVTLRTLTAVSAGASKHKSILTLASGAFSAAGGHVVAVTLHLSAKARALLSKSHQLRVRATIVARDQAGASHTTVAIVTLRAPKRKTKH